MTPARAMAFATAACATSRARKRPRRGDDDGCDAHSGDDEDEVARVSAPDVGPSTPPMVDVVRGRRSGEYGDDADARDRRARGGERTHGASDVLALLRALDLAREPATGMEDATATATTTATTMMAVPARPASAHLVHVHVRTHSREKDVIIEQGSLLFDDQWARKETLDAKCSSA